MVKDIVPDLLDSIKNDYDARYIANRRIATINKKIANGSTSYIDAHNLAKEIGNIRAKTYKNVIRSSVLPDGRMYYNIADRVLRDNLKSDYNQIAKACETVQTNINKKNGIGLKAQKPDFSEDGIEGLINRLDSEMIFDNVAWILDEPIKIFELKTVDNSVEKNASFQNDVGVRAEIVRTSDAKCCEWCSELAGTYYYPDVDSEVFARHDNCRCTLEYNNQKLTAYSRNFM